jgi:hypothetical protein
MSTSTPVNRRILFARWPVGAPIPEDFKTVNEPLDGTCEATDPRSR